MKKKIALLTAAVFCVMSAVTASAIDYVQNPNYKFNNDAAFLTITSLSLTGSNNIDNRAVLTIEHLNDIRNHNAPVSFRSNNGGYSISINPASIGAEIERAVSLALNLERLGGARTTAAGNTVPANAFVITPASGGDFGLSFIITIDSGHLTAYSGQTMSLFYVSSAGVVNFVRDIDFNSNGTLTVSIDRASYYFLIPAADYTGARGPAGSTGATGPTGATGSRGPAGEDGADGIDGDTGPRGVQGPAGQDGRDGVDGADGRDGAAGGNAADNKAGDWNPGTNAAIGITGLALVAGAGIIMYLFKKRGMKDDYAYDEEDEEYYD